MGGLSAFMAQNVKKPENIKLVVSDRFVDENGKPEEWEVRCLSSDENDLIQRDCTSAISTGRSLIRRCMAASLPQPARCTRT